MLAAAIILFLLIGISCYKLKNVPQSISETAYIVPNWLFTTVIMCLGITVLPCVMGALTVNCEWLGFFMIFGLWCVASSPYYRTEQRKLHYIGAVICFLSAMAISIAIKPLTLLIWIVYPLCLFKKTRKWWLMVAECLCFLQLGIAIGF